MSVFCLLCHCVMRTSGPTFSLRKKHRSPHLLHFFFFKTGGPKTNYTTLVTIEHLQFGKIDSINISDVYGRFNTYTTVNFGLARMLGWTEFFNYRFQINRTVLPQPDWSVKPN